MREVTLIVTDLYLGDGPAARTDTSVPRLAGFETLLGRGVVREHGEWREWSCRRVALPVAGRIPVAPIARLTHARDRSAAQYWLAQCIHLEARVDRVYASVSPPPPFTPDEWREIEQGFNQSFGATGQSLVGGSGDQACLASTAVMDADTTDPVRVRGSDIHAGLPSGPGADGLKRLMTEIQMWLHDHPVNMRREERGVDTVNALWIWGGGRLPERGAAVALPALFGADAFLSGLWQLKGGAPLPLPVSLDAIDLATNPLVVVALESTPGSSQTSAQALVALERDWFAPAIAALRRGQLARVQLHANDRLHSLGRSGLWRLWRQRRPWFEALT